MPNFEDDLRTKRTTKIYHKQNNLKQNENQSFIRFLRSPFDGCNVAELQLWRGYNYRWR
jgi:hypothetical protein